MTCSSSLQSLCSKGAQLLQSKSINVEDAANELINMLCIVEENEDIEEVEDEETGEAERKVSRQSSATPSGRKTGQCPYSLL